MSRAVRRVARVALPIAAAVFAPQLLPGLTGALGSTAVSGLASGAAGLLTGQSPQQALMTGVMGGLGSAALNTLAPNFMGSTSGALSQLGRGLFGSMAPTEGGASALSSLGQNPGLAVDPASLSIKAMNMGEQQGYNWNPPSGGSQQQPTLLGRAATGLNTMWNRDPVGTTLLGVGALGMLGSAGQQQQQQQVAPQVPTASVLNQPFELTSQGRDVDVEAVLRALSQGPAGYRASMFLRNPATGTNQITGQLTPRAATGIQSFAEGGYIDDMGEHSGGGQDDRIPAMLSPGEYVIDATTVADLGDGSSEQGARVLDQMREAIAKHKKRSHRKSIPPAASHPLEYLRVGMA